MTLRDLLKKKLCVLYDVETALVDALPEMAEAATSSDLKDAFNDHLIETENHVARLEKIFEALEEEPEKLESEAIKGLIADGEWVVENIIPENALDATLARAGQQVEHYEIALYEAALSWAEELELDDVAALLEETLDEEKSANERLDEVGSDIQEEMEE